MVPPASPDTDKAMGGNSERMGRSLRQLRDARATWMLMRMLLFAQAIPVAWDLFDPGAGKLFLAQRSFGLTEDRFFSGSFWQPISYGLIHANWPHLLANAACILLLGPNVGHIVAKRTFWQLTLFSVIAGAACFMLLTPASPPLPGDEPRTLVGASAICFGFLVFLTTISPESRFLPLFLSGRSIGIAIVLANLSLALLNPDLPTGTLSGWGKWLEENGLDGIFQVSHACHLGGSLAGFFYGKYLLRPRVTLDSLKRARNRREAAADPRE